MGAKRLECRCLQESNNLFWRGGVRRLVTTAEWNIKQEYRTGDTNKGFSDEREPPRNYTKRENGRLMMTSLNDVTEKSINRMYKRNSRLSMIYSFTKELSILHYGLTAT